MLNFLKVTCLVLSGFISISVLAGSSSEKTLFKEKWDQVQIEATVRSIDKEARKVTLMGPGGNLMTITAGDQIKRFDEIKVGDIVAAKYMSFIAADFNKPSKEDEMQPLTIMAEGGKAPDNMAPGTELGVVVKAVVSIEIINRLSMEVTIKGPRGAYITVPVADEKLITELNVGQRLVIIYGEAVAMSLVKVD